MLTISRKHRMRAMIERGVRDLTYNVSFGKDRHLLRKLIKKAWLLKTQPSILKSITQILSTSWKYMDWLGIPKLNSWWKRRIETWSNE